MQQSSGDLTADRRAAYAQALAADGDAAAAAEIMAQALELVPGWAAGWSLLGDYREKAGDVAGALVAWRELLRLDTAGIFGAGLKLAAHGEGPAEAAPAYVEALFDDYAGRFDEALVERLGYATPGELGAMLRAVAAPVELAFDLGCGTGLMGVELRGLARGLVGVDLSAAMLEQAGRKGIYDRLVHAELAAFLAEAEPAGLMAASDVLNYVGALEPVLAAVAARLLPGGWFGFSLELNETGEALVLWDSLRFAHDAAAAKAACAAAGLDVVAERRTVLRQDRGVAVAGLLLVVRRTPA